jgi:enoyl-[acyl-carrier protein] reductase II
MTGAAEPAGIETRITRLLRIRYPVIQAGMVWTAGSRLAVAVSEAGGLGMIGAGSMKPDLLREQIRKTRARTDRPFAVNIPLARGDAAELARASIEEGMRIVFTSAGHPAKFTPLLKQHGCFVAHVVASVKHALKVREAGCDAVVVEGFEAGGHNGVDELTTMVLVPQVRDAVDLPLIAAGGVADGRGMAAALALGADAVQVGTRFAATLESSAHERYKQAVVDARDTDTVLTLRRLIPTRMLKSPFATRAAEAERRGASTEELAALLGEDRERLGIFEGDTAEGELEAGQTAGLVREVLPAGEVVRRFVAEYLRVKEGMP